MIEHYRKLEKMYLSAPVNDFYGPKIEVAEREATIEITVASKFFHAAHAVHGSVYFKLLDDSAYFAANSMVGDVFVLTTCFTTYITCPVSTGIMRAVGKVVNASKNQIIAESIVYNQDGKQVARGNGIFVRSKIELNETIGYKI